MGHTLVLGRDMNHDQTDVGPEVVSLLVKALVHFQETGNTLVVAPGYSPDFPNQPRPYAEMMADWLRYKGCLDVVVLKACSFNTYGELEVFHDFKGEDKGVLGYDWHLRRARIDARRIGGRDWANSLRWESLPAEMKRFDRIIEPLKTVKSYLPRSWQLRAVAFYKAHVSTRTSY